MQLPAHGLGGSFEHVRDQVGLAALPAAAMQVARFIHAITVASGTVACILVAHGS
jgi:hypothetical protein